MLQSCKQFHQSYQGLLSQSYILKIRVLQSSQNIKLQNTVMENYGGEETVIKITKMNIPTKKQGARFMRNDILYLSHILCLAGCVCAFSGTSLVYQLNSVLFTDIFRKRLCN